MKFAPLLFCLTCYITSEAQSDSAKSYTTARLVGEAPKIDGALDDPAWEQVPWGGGDFRQNQPNAGAPASVQTYFKILYDDKNLYIAFKNADPEPDKIVSRMSRRDGFEGDFVEINIDSYFDKRTAFSFTASVSGVKGDEYVSNNGNNWDANWDPIWYLKTSIVEDGWIAEYRIPLSQLRFADKPEHTWGFQITRRFFRNQERSNYQYIPPDAPGWVHLFAELKGIKGIRPQKQLEIQPYVVAKTETFQREEGNPFMTGKSSGLDFGLDAKIGITSDITLDLTVNPDFGQVEADPSQVNLSAFRLFFVERRPFFIEGNNTLNFEAYNSNNLFYSRQIGRKPQGSVDTDESGPDDVAEYVKDNRNSTILGAAKLTGKNKKGFSWALLESVTDVERAKIDSLGYTRSQMIEPLTNYFVARAQQDINKGNTVLGAMITSTNRKIEDPHLKWLHKNAYSGGIDFLHNWKSRTYYIAGRAFMSHVNGTPESITRTQRASERFFQRPDNNHARVDSSRTALTGTGGVFSFGKGSGKLVYEVGANWLSPELELNDVGFLTQTDQINQWIWIQHRVLSPIGIFRWMRNNFNQYSGWDFDRKTTIQGYNLNSHFEFKNFWSLSTGTSYDAKQVSNADLRGGPALHYPGSFYYWFIVRSDSRKKLYVTFNPQWQWGANNYNNSTTVEASITYRPTNALSLSVQPSISSAKNKMQYVPTQTENGEERFVVAEIDQTVARVSLRATYMVTPNLSIQYWGQPFGATGKYSNFKYITDADASTYNARFMNVPNSWLKFEGEQYQVDENNDSTPEVRFDNPNFNFGQFRSNMVVRWEYIPGSTVFLVWSQEMNGAFYDKAGNISERYKFDFANKAHNVFLLKFTYRFVL